MRTSSLISGSRTRISIAEMLTESRFKSFAEGVPVGAIPGRKLRELPLLQISSTCFLSWDELNEAGCA